MRKIDAAGVITTVAGTGQLGGTGDGGPATAATLNGPADVAVRPDGIYMADTGNSCVRAIDDDGTIATVAGTCGAPGFAGAAARRPPRGSTRRAASRWTPTETFTSRTRTTSASAWSIAELKRERSPL